LPAIKQLIGIEYPFPEDCYKGLYIEDIANSILEEEGGKYKNADFHDVPDFFIEYSYQKILSGIRDDLRDFGITFDTWQSERELYESGEVGKAIEDLKIKGHVYEKEGALWFRGNRIRGR
jgi:arginyl-tRNA synthetase